MGELGWPGGGEILPAATPSRGPARAPTVSPNPVPHDGAQCTTPPNPSPPLRPKYRARGRPGCETGPAPSASAEALRGREAESDVRQPLTRGSPTGSLGQGPGVAAGQPHPPRGPGTLATRRGAPRVSTCPAPPLPGSGGRAERRRSRTDPSPPDDLGAKAGNGNTQLRRKDGCLNPANDSLQGTGRTHQHPFVINSFPVIAFPLRNLLA